MTGKPLIDKILLFINLVIVCSACALILYSHLVIRPAPIDEKKEFKNLISGLEASTSGPSLKLPAMTINLSSPQNNRLHYIDMEINFIAYNEESIDLLKENQHKVQDLIIQIGSDMDVDEIATLSGKILYTERIRTAINEYLGQYLGQAAIKQVLFTRFIIQ